VHHDKMASTKTNTYNNTKHAEQKDVTDIHNTLFLCVLEFSIFLFFFRFLKTNSTHVYEMLSYRLGTVNDFYLGYKPALSYSKPQTALSNSRLPLKELRSVQNNLLFRPFDTQLSRCNIHTVHKTIVETDVPHVPCMLRTCSLISNYPFSTANHGCVCPATTKHYIRYRKI